MARAENALKIVQRFCAEQANVLRAALGGIAGSDQVVHDARVACRRLSTAFRLAEDCFEPARAQALRRRIKDVLRLLGAIRDAEVLVQQVEHFAALADSSRSRSLRFLQLALARKKARILKVLQRKRYSTLPEEIRALSTRRSGESCFRAGSAFVSLHKRLAKLESWRRRGDKPARLHRLRIQFKKLRYAAEFFSLFEKKLQKTADFARRFQNLLGDYHDAVVLEEELKRAAHQHADEILLLAIDSARTEQQALRARFRKLWSRRRIKRLRKEIDARQK